MTDTAFTAGIIGHRDLGGHAVDLFVQSCCHRILSALKNQYPGIRVVSAISQGADTIFAQCAVSLNIPLESVIPFENFQSDFKGDVSHERYCTLRSRSDIETRLNFSTRSHGFVFTVHDPDAGSGGWPCTRREAALPVGYFEWSAFDPAFEQWAGQSP